MFVNWIVFLSSSSADLDPNPSTTVTIVVNPYRIWILNNVVVVLTDIIRLFSMGKSLVQYKCVL